MGRKESTDDCSQAAVSVRVVVMTVVPMMIIVTFGIVITFAHEVSLVLRPSRCTLRAIRTGVGIATILRTG